MVNTFTSLWQAELIQHRNTGSDHTTFSQEPSPAGTWDMGKIQNSTQQIQSASAVLKTNADMAAVWHSLCSNCKQSKTPCVSIVWKLKTKFRLWKTHVRWHKASRFVHVCIPVSSFSKCVLVWQCGSARVMLQIKSLQAWHRLTSQSQNQNQG